MLFNNQSPSPFDEIVSEAEAPGLPGADIVERRDGFLKRKVFLLRCPRQPIPLPVQSGIVICNQRLRLQGAVVAYSPAQRTVLVDRLWPKSGPRPNLQNLADYVVNCIRADYGKRDQPLGTEGLNGLARHAQGHVLRDWGLEVSLHLLDDKPPTVRVEVAAECLIRSWPKPIPVFHSIVFVLIDAGTAAAHGQLSPEQLTDWANGRLKGITTDVLGSLTIDELARDFRPALENRIRDLLATAARAELGYAVDVYTATPDIGVQALLDGFPIDVVRDFCTEDFQEATFALRLSGRVKFRELNDALLWLDRENPDESPRALAERMIAECVKDAIQERLYRTSTYRLCMELESAPHQGQLSLRDELIRHVRSALKSASIRAELINANISRPQEDKLAEFQSGILRVCSGKVTATYAEGTEDEITLTASYQCRVTGEERHFPTFIARCYRSFKNPEEVKRRIEEEISSHATQELQSPVNHTVERMEGGQLVDVPVNVADLLTSLDSEHLKRRFFKSVSPSLLQNFGLHVEFGPLLRTAPKLDALESATQLRLAEVRLAATLKIAENQAALIQDTSVADIADEELQSLAERSRRLKAGSDRRKAERIQISKNAAGLLQGSPPPDRNQLDG